jgi:hypothetical protein
MTDTPADVAEALNRLECFTRCEIGPGADDFIKPVRAYIADLQSQLAAQRERDGRDAERYRWLRELNWNDAALCVVADPKRNVKLGSDCPSGERLDAAIDALVPVPGGE